MSAAGLPVDQANDFMRLEPQIAQRLQDAVRGMVPAVQVLTGAQLSSVLEKQQHTPALHVIYAGPRVAQSEYKRARLVHRFLVITAVRNVAKPLSGQAAREDAGPLIEAAVNALLGETLAGAAKPLDAVTPPPPAYQNGFFYLPFAFEVETVFHKH